jgi:hypothetical protein
MAVKYRDLDDEEGAQDKPAAWKPQPRPEVRRAPIASAGAIPRVYGAALLLFGVPFWPVAAWFLASGWVVVVNAIMDLLRQSWAVPAPAGVYGLVAAVIVGGIYSRIELKPPIRERDWRRAALLWLVWALVMLSDVGATYRGLERQSVIGALLAIVLTFGPDQAIMRGWRIINGRPPF